MLLATMTLKLFVTLLALNSVKASAININIFADGDFIEKDVSISKCNDRACNQLCLRLGFPGGVCVGDKCKCDNLKEIKGQNAVASHSASEDTCDFQSCDQLCRNLGFPSGACVGDVCYCDYFKTKGHNTAVTSHLTSDVNACDLVACGQLCSEQGYIIGMCLGDECYCGNFKTKDMTYLIRGKNRDESTNYESDHEENMSPKDDTPVMTLPEDCRTVSCHDMCHRLNYIGGMCKGGNCKCY